MGQEIRFLSLVENKVINSEVNPPKWNDLVHEYGT